MWDVGLWYTVGSLYWHFKVHVYVVIMASLHNVGVGWAFDHYKLKRSPVCFIFIIHSNNICSEKTRSWIEY